MENETVRGLYIPWVVHNETVCGLYMGFFLVLFWFSIWKFQMTQFFQINLSATLKLSDINIYLADSQASRSPFVHSPFFTLHSLLLLCVLTD